MLKFLTNFLFFYAPNIHLFFLLFYLFFFSTHLFFFSTHLFFLTMLTDKQNFYNIKKNDKFIQILNILTVKIIYNCDSGQVYHNFKKMKLERCG